MRSVRTETTIDAPIERVWETLIDFASYDAWNPLIRGMRAKPEVGSDADFTIALGERALSVQSKVARVEPLRELVLTGPRAVWQRPFFVGVHFWRLEASDSRTQLVHGEQLGGLVLPLIWWWLEPRLVRGYDAMNRALAHVVEDA